MALYLPGWENIVAVITTWGIGAVLLLLGAAFNGRAAAPEFHMGAGWGLLCLVLTLWGVFLPWSLRLPAVAIVVAALAAQLAPSRRVPRDEWRTLGRLLLVTLPLWAVMAPVRPSQVDTFLNLLPNADYLVDFARLPTASLPPSYSEFPAAPYNTQFLAFLGSFGARDYPAAGMSLLNIMLRLVAGLAIARMLAGTVERVPSWSMLALGMLLVTLFDPGFVPRFHFSAYGETALAVTALLAAILFVEAQAGRAGGGPGGGTVELALILAAMINTKQSGIGLVLALAGAAAIVGAAEHGVGRRARLGETALVLLPAALLYAVWRFHVAHAGVAELVPLPFAEWNWGMLPVMFRGIGAAIAEKPGYFSAVALALVCFPVLLRRQGWSPATRFLGFFAAVLVLYNGFLAVTYIAHFSPEMSAEAHSYFRYNTHLALVLVLALALAVREFGSVLWGNPRFCRTAAASATALALLSPVAFAERLRFDIEMPQPLVWDLAAELKRYLKDGDRLALILPGDDGEIGQMLSDYLASAPPHRRGLILPRRQTADEGTLNAVAAAGFNLAVISCAPPGLDDLPPGAAALVRHDPTGWHLVVSWPYSAGIALSPWQRSRHWPALCR